MRQSSASYPVVAPWEATPLVVFSLFVRARATAPSYTDKAASIQRDVSQSTPPRDSGEPHRTGSGRLPPSHPENDVSLALPGADVSEQRDQRGRHRAASNPSS